MTNKIAIAIAAATAILVSATPAAPQATGVVTGTVTGPDGAGVPGATVTIKSTNLSTVTGPDGSYTIESVPAGTQTVQVELEGFSAETRNVDVPPGGTATTDFTLFLAVVQEEIVTTDDGLPSTGSNKQIAITVGARRFTNLADVAGGNVEEWAPTAEAHFRYQPGALPVGVGVKVGYTEMGSLEKTSPLGETRGDLSSLNYGGYIYWPVCCGHAPYGFDVSAGGELWTNFGSFSTTIGDQTFEEDRSETGFRLDFKGNFSVPLNDILNIQAGGGFTLGDGDDADENVSLTAGLGYNF